jgi:hypothetical protein
MSNFAIRLLTLAVYATALPAIPMITLAQAETSSSKHIKKLKTIQRSPGIRDPWSAGEVCPGMARSFECKGPWPPPFKDDPDRKVPGRL